MLPINHPYFYYLLKVNVVLFEGLTLIYPTLQHYPTAWYVWFSLGKQVSTYFT